MVAKCVWWCGTTTGILNNLKNSILFASISLKGQKGTGNLTELSTA